TATDTRVYRLGEFHPFEGAGRRFLYLVPAGAIFEMDDAAGTLIDRMSQGETSHGQLVADLSERGFPIGDAEELIDELFRARVILAGEALPERLQETPPDFPLLKNVVAYANEKAAAEGRSIDFSLTTNATLLTPAIIEFLSQNRIGVTVSMDGPKEMHDQLRVFSNGRGSYDIIAPKVRALIQNHRTRPITARVTLTAGVTDVIRIFRHLKQDLGFYEVGFAPVTTSPNQLYAINQRGMDGVLDQFHVLADEYLEYALRGEMHGFSNVSDTLSEL